LRVDLVLAMLLPILQYRCEIVKSLSKVVASKSSPAGTNDKLALLNRLTALVKNKILKAKIIDMEWSESIDIADSTNQYGSAFLKQAMETSDKDHQSLCNSAIVYMLRCVSDISIKLERSSLYSEAVTQWATKRTSKLDASFFEGLIHQNPVIAQAYLGDALASAAMNGRSTFLKSESYRLLSLLYNQNLNPAESELDLLARDRIINSSGTVLAAVVASLNDTEMTKTKRIRDVIRATEKVVSFLSTLTRISPVCMTRLHEIKELLMKRINDSESHGIVKSAESLVSSINNLASNKDVSFDESADPALSNLDENENETEKMDVTDNTKDPDANVSKKKKKKTKKKKKMINQINKE
jgi:hypothetical protein